MAAELEMRNGVANMVFAGKSPWHREGVKIQGDEQYDFAGLMALHFEYPLEKLPYFVPQDPTVEPDKLVYVEGKGAYYVWRPDTKKVLGPVGSSYEIVTNTQAFEVLKPLVDQRVASIETGGVLREGADAWLLVRWDLDRFGPDVQAVFGQDGGILPYATVMANHNGRRGVMLGHTAIRIVCANTLGMAETRAVTDGSRWRTVLHKGDARSKLVEAAQELFSGVVAKFEVIAKQYRLLMACRLEDEDFSRMILDIVAPDPRKHPKFNPDAKLAGLVVERADTKRRELRRLWEGGSGHRGDHSCWEAYNAVAECLDHNRELFPSRAGSYRTASLLNGELANLKNRVLDALVAHAHAVAA